MIRSLCLLAACSLFHAAVLHAGEDAAALVEKLRDNDFDTRRSAAEKLAALGESAREALELAANGDDIESREAAAAILARLNTASLRILAFDRDGRPAAGAEAEVKLAQSADGQPWQGEWNGARTENLTIPAAGVALIPGLAPKPLNTQFAWKKWNIAREASSYSSLQLERGETPIVFVLAKSATLTARVQDAAGKPLKDARVQLFTSRSFDPELLDLQLANSELWERNTPVAVCDAAGLAKFEDLAEGLYQTIVRADGYDSAIGSQIRLREGDAIELPPVSLKKKNNGKLNLTLHRADGSPLRKTKVSLQLEYLFDGPRAAELRLEASKLKAQLNMRRPAELPESDEDGKVTVEDLRPGRYRLRVSSGSEPPWQSELTVAAGAPTDLPALKPIAVGSIKGKVIGSDGKGMQYASVSARLENDEAEGAQAAQMLDFRMRRQSGGDSAAQTQSDGAYELKNLAPGRYSLSIATRRGQPIMVYGVNVEADKAAAAPDAALPAAAAAAQPQTVSGVVLLPDGKPAGRVSINLSSGYSRWGTSCDENGKFTFSLQHNDSFNPTRCTVRAPGCKPGVLDMATPGLKFDAITIRLERQEYGSLRIRVVDTEGKPLDQAFVRPAPSRTRQVYYRQTAERRVVTGRNGEARLSGLASGERLISVQRDGYYLLAELKATVAAESEGQVTAVMHRGLTVRGRVALPPGLSHDKAVVALSGGNFRSHGIRADGIFEFESVLPGEYKLFPIAAGMVSSQWTKLKVKPFEAPPDASLRLDRLGGAAVLLAGQEGCGAALMPAQSWDPLVAAAAPEWHPALHTVVDSNGRAEFLGAVPGTWDLVLAPNSAQLGPYRNYNQPNLPKRAAASLVAGKVAVRALKSADEIRALEAVAVKVQPGTASVSGRIVCEPATNFVNNNIGTLSLKVCGAAAFATASFGYPSEVALAEGRQLIVIGAPPGGKRPAEPGSFQFHGLPAGEYKLIAELTPYRYNQQPQLSEPPRPRPALLTTFTVRAGEAADLGAVKFPLSPDIIAETKNAEDIYGDSDPEDQIPGFQP